MLKPLHGNVVIKQVDSVKRTDSGIYIPDSSTEKPEQGTVLAVGDGKMMPDGSIRTPIIAVGDTIVFHKNVGKNVKVDGEEFIIMSEDDILAVVV